MTQVKLMKKEKRKDKNAFYLQHVPWAEDKEKLLTKAGFIRLKSEPVNGTVWVVWYLPGSWFAKGPIRGKNGKQILRWLLRNINPGEIVVEGDKAEFC